MAFTPGDVDVAALIDELTRLRRSLCAAGEPRAVIRRLDDTIDYLHHLARHDHFGCATNLGDER